MAHTASDAPATNEGIPPPPQTSQRCRGAVHAAGKRDQRRLQLAYTVAVCALPAAALQQLRGKPDSAGRTAAQAQRHFL